MRILALDSALSRASATLVSGRAVLAGRQRDQGRDQAAILPMMARECLREAGVRAEELDGIGVTVGPGSFTGIRAGLALALGLGQSAGCQVVGVTVGEALAAALPDLGERALWCAIPSRRGHVFLEIGGQILSAPLSDLPRPAAPVAIAGSAAVDVASRLAAQGADVMLTDAELPSGRYIGAVAERRMLGQSRPLGPEPLYIDPPQAKPQGGGRRS